MKVNSGGFNNFNIGNNYGSKRLYPNLSPLKKDTISFSGGVKKLEIKDLTDEEFESIKKEIETKLETTELREYDKEAIKSRELEKPQAYLLNQILNCNTAKLNLSGLINTVFNTKTQKEAVLKAEFLNRMITGHFSYKKGDELKYPIYAGLSMAMDSIQSEEDLEAKFKFMSEVVSDRNLFSDEDTLRAYMHLGEVTSHIKDENDADIKYGIMKKAVVSGLIDDNDFGSNLWSLYTKDDDKASKTCLALSDLLSIRYINEVLSGNTIFKAAENEQTVPLPEYKKNFIEYFTNNKYLYRENRSGFFYKAKEEYILDKKDVVNLFSAPKDKENAELIVKTMQNYISSNGLDDADLTNSLVKFLAENNENKTKLMLNILDKTRWVKYSKNLIENVISNDIENNSEVSALDNISKDSALYSDGNFINFIQDVFSSFSAQETKNLQKEFLIELLNNKNLYNENNSCRLTAEGIIQLAKSITSKEDSIKKGNILNQILADEKIEINDNPRENGYTPNKFNLTESFIIGELSRRPDEVKSSFEYFKDFIGNKNLYDSNGCQKIEASALYHFSSDEITREADKKYGILDKILTVKTKNNSDFLVGISHLSNDKEGNIDEKYRLLKMLLDNDKTCDNEGNLIPDRYALLTIASSTKSKEDTDIKYKMYDFTAKNIDFIKNKNDYYDKSSELIKNIVTSTKNEVEYQLKTDVINKVKENNDLLNDSNFMHEFREIIGKNDEKSIMLLDFLNEFLSLPNLIDKNGNMNIQANILTININNVTSKEDCNERLKLYEKILQNENLTSNENLIEKIASIGSRNYYNNNNAEENISQLKKISSMLDKLTDENNNPLVSDYSIDKLLRLIDKNNADELFSDIGKMAKVKGIDKEHIDEIIQYIYTQDIRNDESYYNKACEFVKETSSLITTGEILPNQMIVCFASKIGSVNISPSDIRKLNKVLGDKKASGLSIEDTIIASSFIDIHKKQSINEITMEGKKKLLKSLISNNVDLFSISEELKKDFPLIPKDQEEYCTLLPTIVRALGIETNPIDDKEIEKFDKSLKDLSKTLEDMQDDDFNALEISQEYDKSEFIKDVLSKTKDLTKEERQKVFDYYGFELHHNKKSEIGYSITGYPVNLNNGKKLAQITDENTKKVIEDLRYNVIKFSENNRITASDKNIETSLNEIAEIMPEIRPMIGKIQAGMNGTEGSHDFDILKHSLKVLQRITQSDEYKSLNSSDKKIMRLAAILHDITKKEGQRDKTHTLESSFDAFFISKKKKLTRDEEIKLYTLIKNHEWLSYANHSQNADELKERLQSISYDLRHDNLLDMSLIFTHADLMAVKKDDSFHTSLNGNSRCDFNGEIRSFKESADYYAEKIRQNIEELKYSQPMLPVTEIPSADKIRNAVNEIYPDGSTDVKGVYIDYDKKSGKELVILKYNEIEDFEELGFKKGSTSKGITTVTERGEKVNTGNIKFFAHGLDFANQLAKFDAFSLIDSDALLSVSYTERPESKYRFYRPQGVLLNTETKYIHGGGETDRGSGCGKRIKDFKEDYIFGGERECDRVYISNLIKETLGFNDEEYLEFVKRNENKPFTEIEPEELREKVIKAFAEINSSQRNGEREYNEMYISNPKEPMAVFVYNINNNEKIGNPIPFLHRETIDEYENWHYTSKRMEPKSVKDRTEFLRSHAIDRNIPLIVFGD